MPSIPKLDPPLADPHVRLRDAAERDIPEILIAHEDDPELHSLIGLERPPSGAELGRQAEEEARERAAGVRARLTILEPDGDEFRGRLEVHEIDWQNSCAQLAVWVVRPARGRGLARGALRLAARWLFEVCGLARVQLLAEPGNEPLLRAARGAGFVCEGVLRGHTRRGGRRHDVAICSLLASDLDGSPAPSDRGGSSFASDLGGWPALPLDRHRC